jgi:hypothetical protein
MSYFTAEVRNALVAKFGETVTAAQLAFEVERAAYAAALKGELMKIARGVFALRGGSMTAAGLQTELARKAKPVGDTLYTKSYESLGAFVEAAKRAGLKVEGFTGAFAFVDGVKVGMIDSRIVRF